MLELRLAFHRGAYAVDKHNLDLHRNQEEQRFRLYRYVHYLAADLPERTLG